MTRVYSPGPQPAGVRDKCDWIVESLSRQPSKYSRSVKVVDAYEDSLRRSRDLGTPPLDVRGLLEEAHAAEYIESARGSNALEYERSSAGVLSLWLAACQVQDGREDGVVGRIVGSLGGGGHHARASTSVNGQTFNSLAVAAIGLTKMGMNSGGGRVLILDLDASCGGGTASLIAGVPGIRQVDIAVNDTDAYADTENASLRVVRNASDYLSTIQESLCNLDVEKERGHNPVCIYSAGVDAFEKSPGGLPGVTAEMLAERDRLVFKWCRDVGIRTAFTIGGGDVSDTVSQETLVGLHRQTIEMAEAVLRKEQRNEKRGHR